VTLLLREIVGFVAGAGLWLLALGAIAGAIAAGVLYLADRRVAPREALSAAVAGGLVAALAHRLGLDLWAPEVGGRPLPVVWAAIGAAGLAGALAIRRSRTEA
jgi:hypothetical protein